jgi:multidrug efflux pump subunit AcrB
MGKTMMILKQRALLCAVLALFPTARHLNAGTRPTFSPDESGSAGAGSVRTKPRPAIIVEAVHPGAGAQVIADVIAAPIERQVHGVEKMLYMKSRCASDGRYTLTVTFAPGVDLGRAQTLVQKRVSLALPILPDAVVRRGVTVKKKPPGVLMLINFSSLQGRYDDIYLSNYAAVQLKDELARVAGVSEVLVFGPQAGLKIRIWLDPNRLTARDLTAGDVVKAIEQQNVQALSGPVAEKAEKKGEPFVLSVETLGRLTDAEQFADLILKTTADGRRVRLKDVARIELGKDDWQNHVSLNGKPGVVLAIYPSGGTRLQELSPEVRDKLSFLRARLPDGLRLEVAFDFTANLEAPDRPTTPEYLLLDPVWPAGAATERKHKGLRRCEELLRDVEGVKDVLTLSDNPFDLVRHRPCLLVRLAPAGKRKAREQVTQSIRSRLEQVKDMTLRVRDLSGPAGFPRCGYPVHLVIHGPEADKVRELANKLCERLRDSKKLTDLWTDPESTPRRQLQVAIDRTQANALGVAMEDVLNTLRVSFDLVEAAELSRPGRTWQVTIGTSPPFRKQVADLKALKIRNAMGKMVALSQFIKVREIEAPAVIDRFNGQALVEITANAASGVSLAQIRTLCNSLAGEARQELGTPAAYRLSWLSESQRQPRNSP